MPLIGNAINNFGMARTLAAPKGRTVRQSVPTILMEMQIKLLRVIPEQLFLCQAR